MDLGPPFPDALGPGRSRVSKCFCRGDALPTLEGHLPFHTLHKQQVSFYFNLALACFMYVAL